MIVGVGAIVIAGGWWFSAHKNMPLPNQESGTEQDAEKITGMNVIEEQGAAIGDENLATFSCDRGKSITAVFERDIVGLTLSDGRQMTLRQARSDTGVRYLSNDSKIEFSGKGNEATLIENGKVSYTACVAS